MLPRTDLFKPLRGWPDLARQSPIVDTEPPPITMIGHPSARLLIGLAARHWRVRPDLLAARTRNPLVVAARQHAMWLIRTHTGLSLPLIGQLLGNRDHTTVLHGIAQHQDRMAGRVAAPFIWSDASIRMARQLINSGCTLRETWCEMGITRGEMMLCPAYRELKREARRRSINRRVLANLAARQGAVQ